MTANELYKYFIDGYGLTQWPSIQEVDHETYANVVDIIFKYKISDPNTFDMNYIPIAIGLNDGIIFKNVELILSPNFKF